MRRIALILVGAVLAFACESRLLPRLATPATLTVTTSGHGRVLIGADATSCPPTCEVMVSGNVPLVAEGVPIGDARLGTWSAAGCEPGAAECVVLVDGTDLQVHAAFFNRISIAATAGVAQIVSSPAGIDCPGSCDAYFDPSAEVVLRTEGPFLRWGVPCAGDGTTCVVAAEPPRTISVAPLLAGQVLWAYRIGDDADNGGQEVCRGPGNQVFATGSYRLNIATPFDAPFRNNKEAYLLRLDARIGTIDWFATAIGTGEDEGYGLSFTDRLYWGGTAAGNDGAGVLFDFPAGPDPTPFPPTGEFNGRSFWAAVSTSGALDWILEDQVTVVDDGTFRIAGVTSGSGAFVRRLVDGGEIDVRVRHLRPTGVQLGTLVTIEGPGKQDIAGLTRVGLRTVAVGGEYDTQPADGTPFAVVNKLSPPDGGLDGWVALIGTDGDAAWATRIHSIGTDLVADVHFDGEAIVVVGGFSADLFVDGTSVMAASEGAMDVFVMWLRPADGAVLDVVTFGGKGNDQPGDVDVRADGEILICGKFEGETEFGEGTIVSVLDDMFVVRLDPRGIVRWGKTFGGSVTGEAGEAAFDVVRRCTWDGDGGIIVSGVTTSDTIDLGAFALTREDATDPPVKNDGVLFRMAP